jgi:GNAT superfamily N-acetyltransferase
VDFVCEALAAAHDLSAFACGNESLDRWLRASARDSDGRDITRTYVFHRWDNIVVAYYALMPYFIESDTLTAKQGRGLPDRVPAYLITKLALDSTLHGQRLGSQVLASAVLRAASASRETGGRFIVVDAIDEAAASFYSHHGFETIDGHPDRLILRTRGVEAHLPPT